MRNFVDFRSERSIWKIFLFLIVCLLFPNPGKAQYSFSAVKGIFTPLTNGTPVNSIQRYSSLSGTIDIGFTFKFNGHPYDRLKASASGFITFKKFPTWDGMDSSVIAPLGFNALSGEKGTASYKTEGDTPNRVFTFEWLNWKWDWDAAQPGISFQVKLYETTNRIEFIYRQEAGELNKPFARIGLMFQQTGKSMFLSDAGENPKAYSNVAYYVYQKPATGQIYRFDELILPEPANHVTNFVNDKSGVVSLKWTDSRGETLPDRYLILVSDKSFEDINEPVDGTEIGKDLNLMDGKGAAYVDYGIQKFSGFSELKVNSTYYFKIYPVSNYFFYTNYKTEGNVAQLKINTSIDLATVTVNISESVIQNTSTDIQYSLNSTDGKNGNWTDCDPVKTLVDFKTGGYDLWVRQKSDVSNKLLLMTVAPQLAAPLFSINFMEETTVENIPGNVEYSFNLEMNPGNKGKDSPVALFPGNAIYFRTAATSIAVASAVQTLLVPSRPNIPAITVDFASEKTRQPIPASIEYASAIDMKNPENGSGDFIKITPDATVFFRYKASPASFKSEIQTLIIPPRPDSPKNIVVNDSSDLFNWDLVNGYPNAGDYEYSTDNGITWSVCSSRPFSVGNISIGEGNLHLRVKFSSSNFTGNSVKSKEPFTVRTGVLNLDASNIKLYPNPATENIYLENLPQGSIISVLNSSGKVVIQIKADSEKVIIPFNLLSGLWVIKVKTPKQEYQSKLLKL